MLVCELVHDPGEVALVGERGPPHDAGERVGDVGGAPHVVHEDVARLGVDGERATGAAGAQHVSGALRGHGFGDDGARHEHATGVTLAAADAQQQLARRRRLDTHAGALEQVERGGVDGVDGLVGPERTDDGMGGRAQC